MKLFDLSQPLNQEAPTVCGEIRRGGGPKAFPDSDCQLTPNALFPQNCLHIENLEGEVDAPEIQNQGLAVGCFPCKFKGGEAAFARLAGFLE